MHSPEKVLYKGLADRRRWLLISTEPKSPWLVPIKQRARKGKGLLDGGGEKSTGWASSLHG